MEFCSPAVVTIVSLEEIALHGARKQERSLLNTLIWIYGINAVCWRSQYTGQFLFTAFILFKLG